MCPGVQPGQAEVPMPTRRNFRNWSFPYWHWFQLTGLSCSSHFLQVLELCSLLFWVPSNTSPRPISWWETKNLDACPSNRERKSTRLHPVSASPACWMWHRPAEWGVLMHSPDWYIKQAGNKKIWPGSNLILFPTVPSGHAIFWSWVES